MSQYNDRGKSFDQKKSNQGFDKFHKKSSPKTEISAENRNFKARVKEDHKRWDEERKENNNSTQRSSFGGDKSRPYQDFKKPGFKREDGERSSFSRDNKWEGNKGFNKDRDFKKPGFKREDGERSSFSRDNKWEGNKGFNKDRDFKKPGFKREDGERSSFGRDNKDRNFKKSGFNGKDQFNKGSDEKKNLYSIAFGRLDDDEYRLKMLKKKQEAEQEAESNEPEVSFSKSIDKWEPEEAPEFKSSKFSQDEEGKWKKDDRSKSKFQRKFDYEQEHEKAYEGSPRKRIFKPQNQDTKDPGFQREVEDDNMPLNKYIAHCDVCSRRDAVNLIKNGKIKVNGEIISEPGFKVSYEDEVMLNDQLLRIQKNLIYILLNKPKGFITTTDDPKGRKTVMDLFTDHIDERIFPVGRLDRNTTGLLLLTNDGELAQKLAHPKNDVRKIYQVTLDKNLSKPDFDKIVEGLELEDGKAPVDELAYLDNKNEIGIQIHSGKNRIVRRIFESLGYVVEKLDRVVYAGLTKKNVMRGKWRFLSKQEVINLKHLK